MQGATNEQLTKEGNASRVIDTAVQFSLVALCSKVETEPPRAGTRVIFSSHHCASGRAMSPPREESNNNGDRRENPDSLLLEIDVSFSFDEESYLVFSIVEQRITTPRSGKIQFFTDENSA